MINRRTFLWSSSAAAITATFDYSLSATEQISPPVARTVKVVDRRHGLTLPDPYRWMEDTSDPDWMPFVRGQAEYARQKLDALPGHSKLLRRVQQLSGSQSQSYKVQEASGLTFIERRPLTAERYTLFVSDAGGANERLIFDPGREFEDKEEKPQIDFWSASPDGKFLAIGTSFSGSEDSIIRVLSVADGAWLPESIDRAQYARLAWLPDSTGFFVSRLAAEKRRGASDYYHNSEVWLHMLGTKPKEDIRVIGGGDLVCDYEIAAEEFPGLIASENSEWVLLQVSGAVRRHNPVFAARLEEIRNGSVNWQIVASPDDKVTNIALIANDCFFVSEKGAPNGKLLRRSLSNLDSNRPETVVPENEFPIEPTAHDDQMVATSDAIYFVRIHGGAQVVYRAEIDGKTAPLEMPFEAGVRAMFASTDSANLFVLMGGWVQSNSVWKYDPKSAKFADYSLDKPGNFNPSLYESFQIHAEARDGTQVPVSVIRHKDRTEDGAAIGLALCYSAYGRFATPSFNARMVSLLERGVVISRVHARGGGELGSRWAEAGKKATKSKTWQDFIDASKELTRQGIVAKDRLTIFGGSAGGVAVGRAMTEAPELFAGAIFNVALINTTRLEAEPTGPSQYDEFGDPGIEGEFHALYKMDTYQHVQDGARYPRSLIMHGINDSRVSAWQSAKLAARIQASGNNEAWLRIGFEAGHGGSSKAQADAIWADIASFVLNARSRH